MQAGSSQYIQQLQDLQKKLSSDDPINIQFTSVPLKILCSSCLALCLVIFDNHLSHCKNQRHTSLSHNDVCYQGTTGSPKGATLSHHNIVNNAYIIGRRVGYDWRVSKPRRQIDVCSLCANRYVLPCVSWTFHVFVPSPWSLWTFLSLTCESAYQCPCFTALGPWAVACAWPCMVPPSSSPPLGTTGTPIW